MTAETIETELANFLAPLGDCLAEYVFYEVTIGTISIELIVLWMALPMIFFTCYFGFINLTSFKLAWKIVRGHYRDDNAPGEVTQFQALSTALSGTVGLGNIAGVAIAIAMGGPGATFWMIIIGLMAMSLKFAECTLGVKYREIHEDGTISGGPMYYLRKGLKNRGLPKLGAVLSLMYAMLGLTTVIQVIQVNQAYSQFSAVTGFDNGIVFGVCLALLTAIVIMGGIKSIGNVTSKLVPFMAGIYIFATIIILLVNIQAIPAAIEIIFIGAFNLDSMSGGIVGVIVVGMRRAVYSTEAGLGSATIVHATAKTYEPVSEGVVALMEPFIDTVVVSTMTALVIVTTGAYKLKLNDIQMTSAAFESVIDWFPWVLAIAVLLFAFSTIISWGYYCEKIWTFIFGESRHSVFSYKILYVLLLIPAPVMSIEQVVNIMDSLFFLLAIPNIIGLYIMAPELKADVKSYFSRLKRGEIKDFSS